MTEQEADRKREEDTHTRVCVGGRLTQTHHLMGRNRERGTERCWGFRIESAILRDSEVSRAGR